MKPEEVIKKLSTLTGRLDIEDAIRLEAINNNVELFEGFRLAFDPLITFGVKAIDEAAISGPGLSWDEFAKLTDDLRNRRLTGNAAINEINNTMQQATVDQWNYWYRLILSKGFRHGFSHKTINKALKKFPHFQIPIFGCQLAQDSSTVRVLPQKYLVEPKLDGVRLISIVYPSGQVDHFSRNGIELFNFHTIADQLAAMAKAGGITEPTVFDGEVVASSFQALMKQARRKKNADASDSILNMFDILPLKDFLKGEYRVRQDVRTGNLQEWHTKYKHLMPSITIVEQVVFDMSSAEGEILFDDYFEKVLSQGYEGLMLKNPAGFYEIKRSADWLKLKPFIEVTLEIVGIVVGTGRNASRLGAFSCFGIDDGKEIAVHVGSGFTDEQREEFFDESLLGQLIEVRADAITQNQDGTYSLRFPRFKTFRGFEPGEKI